jgi:hypothetical protein
MFFFFLASRARNIWLCVKMSFLLSPSVVETKGTGVETEEDANANRCDPSDVGVVVLVGGEIVGPASTVVQCSVYTLALMPLHS